MTVSSNDLFDLLNEMDRIRMVEEGTGHWMGLNANPGGGAGVAHLGRKVSVSRLDVGTIGARTGPQPEPATYRLRGPGAR